MARRDIFGFVKITIGAEVTVRILASFSTSFVALYQPVAIFWGGVVGAYVENAMQLIRLRLESFQVTINQTRWLPP